MQIGIDSFVAALPDPGTGHAITPRQRISNLMEEIELADKAGLDVFGIGEHHRKEFLDSSPGVLLGAAAMRTQQIRLTSAVTVLSAADPVRVFQDFATLDLLSNGRAEIVAGRGSFTESFPLFGYKLQDYDDLFSEKLDLLLKLRDDPEPHWTGRFRTSLSGQSIYPRPLQQKLPIWVGVGGSPQSFVRAGALGLPLMVAIIGGEPARFRPLIELYRDAGRRAGHDAQQLQVGLHLIGFVGDSSQQAADDFYPGYAQTFTKVGKERGWPPTTRAQYEALRNTDGALTVGDDDEVSEKILKAHRDLGGLHRVTLQMSVSTMPHSKLMRSIELLGTHVRPRIQKALGAAGSLTKQK